ncbi:MAG: hypothetical protein ACRETU_11535 [Steroidobacterales bacterium]
MTTLAALWLPILLSAVFVFVVSSILHMAPLWHKSDYPRAAKESEILDALRPFAVPPGDYMMPRPANSKEMRTPEFMEKLKKGPVLTMTVFPNGGFSMARNLIQWFLYCILVSYFAAYIAGRSLPPGTEYLRVFQLIGASAFASYALALLQMSIWYRRAWSLTVKSLVDGLIYGAVTAGTFGWLWPHAL